MHKVKTHSSRPSRPSVSRVHKKRPMSQHSAQRRVQHLSNQVSHNQHASRSFSAQAHPSMGMLGRFLEGKHAIVTGSTSGIGLGIARQFAAHGANLTLNGFGEASVIEQLQKDLAAEYNIKVRFSPADMSKADEIHKMIHDAKKEFGTVDILVNNAGIQHISPVETFPDEKWDQIMAINLSAVFHATKAVVPLMKEQGWGRIINISSVHGLIASVNKSAYVAAKHGVMGFTKASALELAGSGVTVNAINPGWVLTPLVQKQIELRAEKNNITYEQAKTGLLGEKQPSAEFVTVEDLGNFASFLSSPYSNQMTGAAYVCDGGWTAQ